jgi:hypothetical protein
VRCWLPFCAFFAAILWCHGSRFIFYGSRFIFSQNRTLWRAASSEAFALHHVIVAGCGRVPKAFPKRAHKRACSRLVRTIRASVPSQAKHAMRSPTSKRFFTTKPRATRNFGVRYARRPRRTREGRGRGERYARTIVSALHVS